ncbi:AAA family ATPase [Gracilibacillus timonensis]|uniref:AAA family ATPase n=1 Tax=Gracilibacillus timonensis TaxID=1816696 RepID=UPI000825E6FA|nr:AAA family ATPase [Gracilibacillus timonensis]
MRIMQVDIYGFGKWVDASFSFDQGNYIEISGDNESGKTTLRQFILYILFGLKPKPLAAYMPKKGSALGGRITLTDIYQVPVTVERVRGKQGVKVYTTDGEIFDENWLNQRLKGMTRDQFESIYTFTAYELQQIQQIDNQALQEVLLTIGMIGSDRIYQAEKNLSKQADELFRPHGKKPVINQQLQHLAATHQQWTNAREKEQGYRAKLEAVETMEERHKELQQDKQQAEARWKQVEQWLIHDKLIRDYYLTTKQLARYPENLHFPSLGLDRLQEWKEQLLPLQSEEQVIRNEMEEIENNIEEIDLLTNEELEELEQEVILQQQQYEQQETLRQLDQQITEQRREWTTTLQQLQLPISSAEVEQLELPFYLEEEWTGLATQYDKLEMERQYLRNDNQSAVRVLKDHEETKKQLQLEQLSKEELQAYQADIQAWQEAAATSRQRQKLDEWKQAFDQQKRLSLLIMGGGIILAIALLFFTDWVWSVVLAVLSVCQYAAFHLYGKTMAQWLAPEQTMTASLSNSEIEARKEKLVEQEQLQTKIQQLDKDIQQQKMEQLKSSERIRFIEERMEQLEQRMADYQKQYPFLQSVSFVYWPKLYQQLRSLKDRADKTVALRLEREALREQLDNVEWEGDPAAKKQEERRKQELQQQLQTRRDSLESKWTNNQMKQKPYYHEIQQLLIEAGAESEQSFIEQGERYQRYHTLQEEQQQLSDSLRMVFTEEELQQVQAGEFAEKHILQTEQTALRQTMADIEEQLQAQQAALSDEKANLTMLEASEDTSLLKHRMAEEQDELDQTVQQWAIYQVALHKLTQAKASYTEKYLPKVLEAGSRYFSRFTLQRYRRILLENDQKIIVEDSQGYWFEISALSRATQDQLYIAIRFALSHVMTERLAVPFLIDDGFVHFDPNRRAEIIQLMEELSKDHQIIYFTANPTAAAVIRLE